MLLAEEPMVARFSDERVGYFEIGHPLYFNDKQQKAEERAFINRWRLEPKPETWSATSAANWWSPRKPIVLWIDPATPPYGCPSSRKGIVEWQGGFRSRGIQERHRRQRGRSDDEEFDIDDVRYSVVTYAASETANAMGPR